MLALRFTLALASPIEATSAPACASASAPLDKAKAPTDNAPTTWVARAQSPSFGTSEGEIRSRRTWPDTDVCTVNFPERLSSPSSVAAPSGNLAYNSSELLISSVSEEGVVRCHM